MYNTESHLQSPFADRLYTNYTPLDPEIEQIHRLIPGPLAEISCLDEKILHLRSMMDELVREREMISSFVDAHRALLSGIRRFPSELLQEIFMYCVQQGAPTHRPKVPILLGRVCSSWRRIVMSTPHLWSFLHIHVDESMFVGRPSRDASRSQRCVAALQHRLELSGSCPLYLYFDIYHDFSDNGMEEIVNLTATSLFQLLVPFSQRWEVIDLRLPLSLFMTFFATFTRDVPLLKSISLKPVGPQPVTTWHSASIFRGPSLRSLSLTYLDLSVSVDNWSHLTHLDLVGSSSRHTDDESLLTTTNVLETLGHCTNLVSCRIERVHDVDTPSLTISLPFLQSLVITETEGAPNDITSFFNALKVPSLRNFVWLHDSFFSEVISSCQSIISQPHSPGIESIDLSSVPLSQVAEYLALLPFLKRLSIRQHLFDDCDFLTLLTPSLDSGKCLCPCLEEIQLTGCIALTEDAICSFVTARTSHPEVAHLKQASFFFFRHKTRDDLPELKLIHGLSLEITYC